MDIKRFTEYREKVVSSVSRAIVGKERQIELVLNAFVCSGHVLLEDVPGTGKTMLLRAFAKSMGGAFRRVQFTPDLLPSDLTGINFFSQKTGEFEFRKGPLFADVVLADEINRATPRTQSALLEAMEEYHVTVDGQTYPLPEPFVVLATQNPVGSAGTQLLPAAQLDRFLIRTSMGYPDAKSQIDILKERHHENPLDKLTAAVSREQLLSLMNDARQVHISDPVYAYVVELVTATRENEFIELGVSPRGALALCRMAKSCAFVRGRDYVIPEDVAAVFDDVCCHRLVLSAKARLHRLSAADVTAEIVKTVKMPQVQEK